MDGLEVRRRDYTRHRDARAAAIRCSECNEYYETSVRQCRRIRKGESRRLCPLCRNLEAALEGLPDRTDEYVMWWLDESGLSQHELGEIAAWIYPEEAPDEPVPFPSRRLPNGEAHHSTVDLRFVRVAMVAVISASSTAA
jgi:hypothetical protein